MELRKDEWLVQTDVQARFVDPSNWSGEWLPIEELKDSYVEHFVGICVPIRLSRARVTMDDVSWGQDFHYSSARISRVFTGKRHYVGLGFRRFLGLSFNGHDYFGNKEVIVRREVMNREFGKSDIILARREPMIRFLQATKQVLLWCVRSHRNSERDMDEFGLGVKADFIKGEKFYYTYEQVKLNQDQKRERPRMAMMTLVFGKCLLIV